MPEDNDIVFNQYGVDLVSVVAYLLEAIFNVGITPEGIWDFLGSIWSFYSVVALLASLGFIIGIIYSYLRINEYAALGDARLEAMAAAWREANGPKTTNDRWSEVLRHVAGENPNDWKLSIIEADIMLGEGLKARGYAGLSIGEQLRGISPVQMASLQDAWDAHRIRNRIAHEGADFVLTHGAAREAIVKYERALKELGAI